MITITGGKLTTWRRMAKMTVDRIVEREDRDAPCRTHEIPLGQAVDAADLPRVEGVPEEAYERLAGRYGHAAHDVLAVAARARRARAADRPRRAAGPARRGRLRGAPRAGPQRRRRAAAAHAARPAGGRATSRRRRRGRAARRARRWRPSSAGTTRRPRTRRRRSSTRRAPRESPQAAARAPNLARSACGDLAPQPLDMDLAISTDGRRRMRTRCASASPRRSVSPCSRLPPQAQRPTGTFFPGQPIDGPVADIRSVGDVDVARDGAGLITYVRATAARTTSSPR